MYHKFLDGIFKLFKFYLKISSNLSS